MILIHDFKKELANLPGQLLSKSFFATLISILIGATFYAYFVNTVILPGQFVLGGLTGICIIIFYVTGIPVNFSYMALNIPLFFLGYKQFNLKYLITTILGYSWFSFALGFFENYDPIIIENKILHVVFGGLTIGASSGIYFRYAGSIGGLDIVAHIIKKKFGLPVSSTFITLNTINLILFYMIYRDLEVALYSGILMYLSSVALQKVQTGFSERNAVLIISHYPEAISKGITTEMDRGVTHILGHGYFTKNQIKIVFTVINLRDLGHLKAIIYKIDPNALITILNTQEVIGRKFISWESAGFYKK